MPEDLKRQIMEAIAVSGDDNHKRLLMLLFRVEEIFVNHVETLRDEFETLSAKMTVPPEDHKDDHEWIKSHREIEGAAKGTALKIAVSLMEKGALIAAGAFVTKFF